MKRVVWPVLVVVGLGVTLAGLAAWWWLARREPPEGAVGLPTPRPEPAAVSPGPASASPRTATPDVAPARPTSDGARPHGPGSAAADADGNGPDGWTIKGNADSGLYHTLTSPAWKRLRAEVWFESEAAAEAAGFKPWDWRRKAS